MPTVISGDTGVSQVQNGSIVQADLAAAILPLGVGQSWSNMTALRTINTDYTNDTGRPIYVSINCSLNTGVNNYLYVSGTLVSWVSVGVISNSFPLQAIVPSGATYRLTNTGGTTVVAWSELR